MNKNAYKYTEGISFRMRYISKFRYISLTEETTLLFEKDGYDFDKIKNNQQLRKA